MSPRPLGRPRPAFITCSGGAEPHLAEELTRLGAQEVEVSHLGVHCVLSEELIWRVNAYSRLGNRVLIPIAEFEATDRGALYEAVKKVRWDWWVHTSQTIAVDASSVNSQMNHTHFIAQVVKDGVVDQLRERFDERPSVDTADPDLPINARLFEDICTLSLDASGGRLHRRGYRQDAGQAPLKETLASLLNHHAGWRPDEPLIDLTCGSGTIIIEAALRAARRPPNWARATLGAGPGGFTVCRWRSHVQSRYEAWLERSPQPSPLPCALWGSDLSKRQIMRSTENAERAGVAELCHWTRGDLNELAPQAAAWGRARRKELSATNANQGSNQHLNTEGRLGVVLMNPPYGERLGTAEELEGFYRALGSTLKHQFAGFEAWLIVEEGSPWKSIGLKVQSKLPVRNGALKCLLIQVPLY